MRRALAVTFLGFGAWLALTGVARADNCDLKINPSDCQNTAWTIGVVTTIAAAAAGAAVASGGLGGGTKTEPTPSTPPEEESAKPDASADPCAEEETRLQTASVRARTLASSMQIMDANIEALEEAWENSRQAGYYTASIDLGFLAGSVWTKPLQGLLGSQAIKQTLAQKVIESGLKAFGKELSKDLVRHLQDQGINWEDLALKAVGSASGRDASGAIPMGPPTGASGKAYFEIIKKALTDMKVLELQRQAVGPGGSLSKPVLDAIRRNVETDFSGPLTDGFSQAISVYQMGEGVFKSTKKMDAIRAALRTARDKRFEAEQRWEDARDEMELARHALNLCRGRGR